MQSEKQNQKQNPNTCPYCGLAFGDSSQVSVCPRCTGTVPVRTKQGVD